MMAPEKAASAALAWWRGLQPNPPEQPGDRDTSRSPGDRGALARLRRCATVAEAMQERETMSLFRFVQGTTHSDLPPVALAAAVLAHVRTDANQEKPGISAARLVGPDSIDVPETALLKPLRFRRLLEADDPDDRLAAFRRMAAMARGSLPVRDMAHALLFWNDQRRTRWIYDYWNAAAPSLSPTKDAPQ